MGRCGSAVTGHTHHGSFRKWSTIFPRSTPNVDVEIVEGSSTELQEKMLDGTLNACFILRGHVVSHSTFEAIAPVAPKVLLSAKHPLAAQEKVSFTDLAGLPAVLSDVKPAGTLVEAMIQSMGFEPNMRWRSSSTETIRSLVERGLAYSVLLSIWPRPLSHEGLPLVLKEIAEPVPANAFGLAFPAGLEPTRKISELLAFGRDRFSIF